MAQNIICSPCCCCCYVAFVVSDSVWPHVVLEELKVFDFVSWINYYCFVLLDCFPAILYFFTFLSKFIPWLKFSYRQKADRRHGWGSILRRPPRVLLGCTASSLSFKTIGFWGLLSVLSEMFIPQVCIGITFTSLKASLSHIPVRPALTTRWEMFPFPALLPSPLLLSSSALPSCLTYCIHTRVPYLTVPCIIALHRYRFLAFYWLGHFCRN